MKKFSQISLMKISLFLILFVLGKMQNDDGGIQIMAQDEDGNKSNFVAPSLEKAYTNETNISFDDLDQEGYKKLDNEKKLNDTYVINIDNIKNLPSAQVILPIRRKGTSHSILNAAPCGGVTKNKADTLTSKGSNIHVMWETINPVAGGNCTVKLSPGIENEKNFTTLQPLDLNLDSLGHFPCGRVKGFEYHEFALPSDYVCDQCTLQWTWITSEGNLYSCSDIIINGNKIEDCLAKCKNGGACFNGKCLCNDGFYGEFCEYSSKFLKNKYRHSIEWICMDYSASYIAIDSCWLHFLLLLL
jgi:hypothetical protein